MIRADGSSVLGMGHISRCATLATSLVQLGTEVLFVTQSPNAHVERVVQKSGATLIPLTGDIPGYREPLGEDDLDQLLELLGKHQPDLLLIDHYGANDEYLDVVREEVDLLALLDDDGRRDLSGIDWILNASALSDQLYSELDAVLLLGVKYALLRPSFVDLRGDSPREIREAANRVLISFGGGETAQWVGRSLRALAGINQPLEITAVVDDSELNSTLLEDEINQMSHSVELLGSGTVMEELMVETDLMLCGGGVTLLEACCLGVPFLAAELSADQMGNIRLLNESGAGDLLPLEDNQAMTDSIRSLLMDRAQRETMSLAGRELIDGLGAKRAAESLVELIEELD